jgi:hypothetical protein
MHGTVGQELAQARTGPAPSEHRDRQASYRARMLAAGLVQDAVWVPARRIAELHAEASRLRAVSGLPLPSEAEPGQLDLFPPPEETAP